MSDSEVKTTSDGRQENSDSNLIVNYLPCDMLEGELKILFDPCGKVEAVKIIRNRQTQESMGYGFIKMSNYEEALKAVNDLTGLKIRDKTLKVSFARKNSKDIKNTNLYIQNLPKNFEKENLENLFSTFGTIIECKVLVDHKTKEKKGIGFVRFGLKSEADHALRAMNGYQPSGATSCIKVKIAEDFALKAQRRQKAAAATMMTGNRYNPYGVMVKPNVPAFNQPPVGMYGFEPFTPPGPFGQMGLNPAIPQNMCMIGGLGGIGGVANSVGGLGLPPQAYSIPLPPTRSGPLWCLFVYNIGKEADEKFLYDLFSPFGHVTSVKVIRDDNKQCKGYGFVNMEDYNRALLAVQSLNGYRVGDKFLQVSFKQNKEKTSRP